MSKFLDYPEKNKRYKPLFSFDKALLAALWCGVFLGLLLITCPVTAEATSRTRTAAFARPAYLEQLESYRYSVEQHRILLEKEQREEILDRALIQHRVVAGETLSGIASLYKTNVQALASWNQISNPNFIRAGQILDIVTVEGTLHRVARGDTLERIAGDYQVEPAAIAQFNLLDERKLVEGQKLVIPGGVVPERRTVVPVTMLASRGERRVVEEPAFIPAFQWPLRGRISSYFGMRNGLFHFGLDIAAPYGEEIKAAAAGIVAYSGIQRGYGRMLIIDHGNGWSTLYAHNSRNLVFEGDRVSAGQGIANVGSSGNATGPHVHLEIIYGSRKLDPLTLLP